MPSCTFSKKIAALTRSTIQRAPSKELIQKFVLNKKKTIAICVFRKKTSCVSDVNSLGRLNQEVIRKHLMCERTNKSPNKLNSRSEPQSDILSLLFIMFFHQTNLEA